jgi:diguanylate cyclase (GGDEF)-like protein
VTLSTDSNRPQGSIGQVPLPQSRASAQVAALTATVIALALLLLWPIRELDPIRSQVEVAWPVLALAFALTVVVPVHFEFRRETHSVTLMEIPLVVGLHLAGPVGLVLARLVGTTAAIVIHGRQRGVKLLFNVGLAVFETCVAVVVVHGLVGGARNGSRMLLATFVAVVVTDLLSGALVSAAIALREGAVDWGEVAQTLTAGLVAALGNTSLGLVGVSMLVNDRRTAWLLLVVAAVLVGAYRAYASLRQQHENLELLHQFTREVGRSDQAESVMAAILTQARGLLRAERAEILRLAVNGQATVRTALGPSDAINTETVQALDPVFDALRRTAAEEPGLLVTQAAADGPVGQALAARGITDAMIAPLHDATGTIGALLVGNRLGDVSSFGPADLRLLQTLASHASVALEKSQLFDSLRREAAEREHQALHDPLTGLPNRTLFADRVRQAVGTAEHPRQAAVLLIDLDRFKEVNDTLGHHLGDLVLKEIGIRLQRSLPADCVIARLGGDEFAILAPGRSEQYDVLDLARQAHKVLQLPFNLEGLDLEVAGSIGIALSPEHGVESGVLLQRADVAMYAAKAAHAGIEFYASERDHYKPRQLALVSALRSALERRELTLHYQPKAELASGRVVGVEALLRWQHPTHGFVPPDEFIPIAESTGLIRPLGLYVLESALGQARAWRDEGLLLEMAVNLSVRNLVDPELLGAVPRLLAEQGIPPKWLTLEITEGQVMDDPDRTIAVLAELSRMGVQVSIDDFGAGYSSLAYVKRLPVNEVKIDKSFITHLATDPADAAIVRSTVELARHLGLRLVAEGVEDRQTWDRLAAMGCDVAQGYYLGRPMPAANLVTWLKGSSAARTR